jgi:hypothetical protein
MARDSWLQLDLLTMAPFSQVASYTHMRDFDIKHLLFAITVLKGKPVLSRTSLPNLGLKALLHPVCTVVACLHSQPDGLPVPTQAILVDDASYASSLQAWSLKAFIMKKLQDHLLMAACVLPSSATTHLSTVHVTVQLQPSVHGRDA